MGGRSLHRPQTRQRLLRRRPRRRLQLQAVGEELRLLRGAGV